jgi:hypothetical protein
MFVSNCYLLHALLRLHQSGFVPSTDWKRALESRSTEARQRAEKKRIEGHGSKDQGGTSTSREKEDSLEFTEQ